MKRVCLTILLLFSMGTAYAEIGGPGALSCGYFLEYKRKNIEPDDIVSWAQGMLSGLNIAAVMRGESSISFPDQHTIHAYVDKSCSDDPLAQIGLVVARMYGELKARRK